MTRKSTDPSLNPSDGIFVTPPSQLAERAYRVTIQILVESGVSGIAALKTAEIAQRLQTTESTLFRHIGSRDQLLSNAINWCWYQLNIRLSDKFFTSPGRNTDSPEAVLEEIDAILQMFSDQELRIWVTGAFLSFRRPGKTTDSFPVPERDRFLQRLSSLVASAYGCETSDKETELAAIFFTNAIATIWFTWLFSPDTSNDGALLSRQFVLHGLESYIQTFKLTCGRS